MNIIEQFIENKNKYPNKKAIVFNEKSYSYTEVFDKVSRLSALLVDMGINKNSHVLIILENSFEFVISMLALAELGAVLVPINITLNSNAINKAILSTKSKYIIGLSHLLEKIILNNTSYIKATECLSIGYSIENCRSFNSIDDKKYSGYILGKKDIDVDSDYILTMTSGSTGNPKPIVFTQKTKLRRAKMSAQMIYNLNENDVIIASSPMYHSLAQRLALLPLLIGATLVILKKFSPDTWLKTVEKDKVTFAILVSSHLELLLSTFKKNKYDIKSLKTIVSSSSLLKENIKQECIKVFKTDFHEIYGTSEVGTVTNLSPDDISQRLHSVGKALSYVDIKIVNDMGIEVNAGTKGEIICKTETLFSRYFNLEQATKKSIIHGYFYTGDIGHLDKDGYLYFDGRKKDVINVGGSLVYPNDIESVINESEEIKESSVIGIADIYFGEAILAILVVEDKDNFNLKDIKRKCYRELADYQQPIAYEVIEYLPRNSMGKIMKHQLKELYLDYDASALIRKIIG